MSAIKSYCKREFQLNMLGLEHSRPSCFHLSVWQTNRSVMPLLIWRALLFITSLAIALASIAMYGQSGKLPFWFIYLTHWGLTLNTVATGFAAAVSACCYFLGPISAEFCLPWYVKCYWVFYNCAVPIAFLITLFYWTVLYEAGFEEELDHVLDVAVHGLNSLVMLLLLISSSHPSRILHLYQPVIFGLTYALFSGIYYLADGLDSDDNAWIYPVVDWSEPGTTVVVVVITGVLLLSLHCAVVGLAAIRDGIAARVLQNSVTTQVEEGLPLRTPVQTII